MALRTIVTDGDSILKKVAKDVKNFGERTSTLLDDMWDTMRDADGIGIAAPQVGVLRRAIVVDVTPPPAPEDDAEDGAAAEADGAANAAPAVSGPGSADESLPVNSPGGYAYELLNPVIVSSDGESVESEGCLSVPGVSAFVIRPQRVSVRAVDRNGNAVEVEGEGILARALCHEIDHLNGVLFTDIAEPPEEPYDGDDEEAEE
jgi:peptide deformylase